jgi:hypothetical protein
MTTKPSTGHFQIDLKPDVMSGLDNIFLQFDYEGDVGSLFLSGRLIADNYNNGTPWRVGLKRFLPDARRTDWSRVSGHCLTDRYTTVQHRWPTAWSLREKRSGV